MPATLNLQLNTLDLGAEAPAPRGTPPIDGPSEPAGFAAMLQLRVADVTTTDAMPGNALPPTGNPLPETEIAITVDGVALEGAEDAGVPLLPVADEQPWESLVAPPGLELRDTAPADEVTLLPQAMAETGLPPQVPPLVNASALTTQAVSPAAADGVQLVSAAPADAAALKPRVEPLPVATTDLSGEFVADARDMRVAPGVQAVMPREIQPREFNVTQVQQAVVQDDGQPVLQDTAARPTAAPLQQAMPMMDELAEPPRPVVQPGVPQAAVSTPVFQPGAFANVAPSGRQADSTFASALQQQLPDLIETPVRETGWGDRIGERVVMMANNQLKTAEIRLTPAELGPVRVQVNVEDGAANITFQAQHAVTRDALEQALPRLREMFAESGLSLGQTSVGEQNVAGNRDGNAQGETRAAGQDSEFLAADDEIVAEERLTRRHEGLLDTFV